MARQIGYFNLDDCIFTLEALFAAIISFLFHFPLLDTMAYSGFIFFALTLFVISREMRGLIM
jgi:hypothetical protein